MRASSATQCDVATILGGAVVDPMLRLIEYDTQFAKLIKTRERGVLGQPIDTLFPELERPLRAVLADGLPRGPLLMDRCCYEKCAWQLTPLRTTRGTVAAVELLLGHVDAFTISSATQGPLQAPSVREVLDGLFAFAGVLLPDGTLIEANRAALEAAGLTPQDVVGRPFEDAFWWSYAPEVQAQLRAAIVQASLGEAVRYDVPVRLGDDYFIIIDFMLAPARDAQGKVQYLIPSGIDISQRKAIEQEQQRAVAEREELLHREQEARAAAERTTARLARLQTLTAALAETLSTDEMKRLLVHQAMDALGADAGALRLLNHDGTHLVVHYSTGMPAGVMEQWQHVPLEQALPTSDVLRTGRPLFFRDHEEVTATYPLMLPFVQALQQTAFAIAPLSVKGRPLGSLSLGFRAARQINAEDRDMLLAMTGQGAQAIERAQLYAAVQEAVETRDTFIAIASHDLRSPITAIFGQAQLLERRIATSPSDQIVRRARLIAEQAQRLNRMVSALLDLPRIQSGQLAISKMPVDLAALTARIIVELQPTLSQHRLELLGATHEIWVVGDEIRLEHVVYNLLNNAIKYSPDGGVITIELMQQASQIQLKVSDKGIGIPAAAQTRLFERYYRAHNVTASGMGIGLYAVREILALHGGTISVESHEGVGSSFTLSLPACE